MSEHIDVTLQVRDSQRERVKAQLEVEKYTPAQRIVRAAARWLVLWTLAVGVFLMALLPFVLVPLLVLLGPLIAWAGYRPEVKVLSTTFKCPHCSEQSTVKSGLRGWPVRLWCSKCGTTVFARPLTERAKRRVRSLAAAATRGHI